MSNLPTETNQHGCLTCPFCKGFEAVQVQQVQVTPQAKPDFAVVCPHCDARGLLLASSVCGLFKWRQFEPEVILLADYRTIITHHASKVAEAIEVSPQTLTGWTEGDGEPTSEQAD